MTDYILTTTVDKPYGETVEAVRAALSDQGFGILTEIDLKAKLKEKLDVEVAPQIILGACRPQLAYDALQAEPSIAALLPCNVVVRTVADGTTVVEAFDPLVMISLIGEGAAGKALRTVADDARQRLTTALAAVSEAGS